MATPRNIEKMASIDAQLRLLAPRKVSDDDKLVEYDALLLDRFLDILQDLHGEDIRQTVPFSIPLLLNYFFFFYAFEEKKKD
jgi:phosphoenolpyruvate carboxylase